MLLCQLYVYQISVPLCVFSGFTNVLHFKAVKFINLFRLLVFCDSRNSSLRKVKNIFIHVLSSGASQVALEVKNLPANVGDTRDVGQSLGREDTLVEGMAINSSILAWRMPWTKESGRLQSKGLHRVGHDWISFNLCVCVCMCVCTLCHARLFAELKN